MKRKKYLLLFLCLTILVIIPGCSSLPGLNNDETKIYGTITDYKDGSPLNDVMVTVNGETTYTNYYGQYQLKVNTGSMVDWKAEAEGYWTETEEFYIYSGSQVVNARLMNRIDFSGTVSGSVTISFGAQSNSLQSNNSSNKELNIDPFVPELNTGKNFPDYVEGEILVKFKPGVKAGNLSSSGQLMGELASRSSNGLSKIKAPANTSTEELYDYYKNLDSVETVSYNRIGYLTNLPDDPGVVDQWHYDNIDMLEAWDHETGSSGVTVAVIDTGYVPHEDLDGNIDTFNDYDFVDDEYDAFDTDSYYVNDNDYRVSHGTHVAGIVGAVGNNGIGVTGVNWDVNILPLRIFQVAGNGNQYCDTGDLYDAIYYAVDNGAEVINLSLAYSSSTPDPWIEDALEYAYNKGVTVVAAAGNDNASQAYYPASSYYTIAVGATDFNNQVADYSNYGSKVDIFAPGGDTESDLNDDGYADGILSTHSYYNDPVPEYLFMDGTSMAAPQVAGVAALLYSAGAANPDQVREIIGRTTTPINDSRAGDVGLLDAEAALLSALTGADDLTEDVQILAAVKSGDTYYVMSDITGADYQDKYQINHVKVNDNLRIIGWINDNNPDKNEIDGGDFFGEYSSTVYLTDGEYRSGVNFNIEYISTTGTMANNDMKVVFGPPPNYNSEGEE